MNREDVEALRARVLSEAENAGRGVRLADMTFIVEGDTLSALCRRWLAVEDAPIREVEPCQQEFAPEEFKLIGTIELPAHTVGKRVRIVPEAGQEVGDGGG